MVVIPVFHAIKSDMIILGNNNIDVLNDICRKALDTQKLFRGHFHSRNFATPGLKDLIEDTYISVFHLDYSSPVLGIRVKVPSFHWL
jgi:hypothetical protein